MNKKEQAKESFKEFLKNYPLTPEDKVGELWTWIEGFEKMYQVSNFGRVRSFHQGEPTIMQPVLGKDGYLIVNLSKGGTKKQFLIHRLVVKYFVANPENKHEIHHIDFNKFNNRYDNLMPVTRGEHRKLEREHAMNVLGIEPPEISLSVHIFEHKKFGKVRFVVIDGEGWIVAADVCRALEIKNHRDAVSTLEEDEKDDVGIPDAIGRNQPTTIINEYGLYRLMFKSRTKEAKKFQRWACHEAIPKAVREELGIAAEPNQPKPNKNDNPDYIPRKVKLLKELIDITDNPDLRDRLIEKVLQLI